MQNAAFGIAFHFMNYHSIAKEWIVPSVQILRLNSVLQVSMMYGSKNLWIEIWKIAWPCFTMDMAEVEK